MRSTRACRVDLATIPAAAPWVAATYRASSPAAGCSPRTAGRPVVSADHPGNEWLGWVRPRNSDEVRSTGGGVITTTPR